MPNLHSAHPRRGDHTEEYQAKYHEYMLKCFARHPWLWATHVWNMFDFAADARDQGGEPGMNHKGLDVYKRQVIQLGEDLHKPVVATGDSHFQEPEDWIYRAVLQAGNGFKDADNQAPVSYTHLTPRPRPSAVITACPSLCLIWVSPKISPRLCRARWSAPL